MAVQLSTAVRNAKLDAIEATIGTSAVLKIRTGAQPADCAAADSGTVLATLSLPSDWMAAAASGQVAKTGTWSDGSADAAGTAGHFRIYDSGGSVCGIQGSCSGPGGGGNMEISPSATVGAGDTFTVTSFTLTEANS